MEEGSEPDNTAGFADEGKDHKARSVLEASRIWKGKEVEVP